MQAWRLITRLCRCSLWRRPNIFSAAPSSLPHLRCLQRRGHRWPCAGRRSRRQPQGQCRVLRERQSAEPHGRRRHPLLVAARRQAHSNPMQAHLSCLSPPETTRQSERGKRKKYQRFPEVIRTPLKRNERNTLSWFLGTKKRTPPSVFFSEEKGK